VEPGQTSGWKSSGTEFMQKRLWVAIVKNMALSAIRSGRSALRYGAYRMNQCTQQHLFRIGSKKLG